MEATRENALANAADRMRINIIRAINEANSEYMISSVSMAEIMALLVLHVMRYSTDDQLVANNDRIVLAKGHAAPVLYAAFREAGLLTDEESLKLTNEAHPIPGLPFVDVSTGSLGRGLSCAAGMAYTGKKIEKGPYRVYCVLEGGDRDEESVKDAMCFSSRNELDNLVAIFDYHVLITQAHILRYTKFEWNIIYVDRHNISSVLDAFDKAARTSGKPTAIVTTTYKKKDEFDEIWKEEKWRGKPLGDKAAHVIEILEQKIKSRSVHGAGDCALKPRPPPNILQPIDPTPIKMLANPNYTIGQRVATREAYGTALVKLGDASQRVIALDANTRNETFSFKFNDKYPDRFIECLNYCQNMIGVAIGCGTSSRTIPFVNTFAAFLTRGFDQIPMSAMSQTDCNFAGSHFAAKEYGEPCPSQMELKDLAMFRSIPGSTVFYPTDAVSTEKAVELAANTKGICFIRTGRPQSAVIYGNDEHFEIGKAKIVRKTECDKVTVVSAGVEIYGVLEAANIMEKEGVHIRVVDLFTVKPIDIEKLVKCAKMTCGRVLTVEDHSPEGGLGDAVASALGETPGVVVRKLAVNEAPRIGHENPFRIFTIGAASICQAVTDWLQ